MIRRTVGLTIVLLFPIIALLALTFYKIHILSSGQEVILPISGYDPRNIISGHYLRYRIEYGIPNLCVGTTENQIGYVCLDQKAFFINRPEQCKLYIRGVCRYGVFNAGIEQFYIPENKANSLEKQIQLKKASVILSVMPNGKAEVKNLLIDGKTWR